MEWSIQGIARAAGTTSRTLRHYGELGLLTPSRTGPNGYRYYDQDALVRLQRILLLRGLGLSLPAIGEILSGQQDTSAALNTHLRLLEAERGRISRQITSVQMTLHKTQTKEQIVPEEAFDGFDHTQYEGEVVERWGQETYDGADGWWRSLSQEDKRGFQAQQQAISQDFGAVHSSGATADSDQAQAVAERHVQWLAITGPVTQERVMALGEMYAADPRFTTTYDQHAPGTAVLIRDALKVYAERNLTDRSR